MSPRRSVADARDTRSAILERAVDVASLQGLEGLTIGSLADDLEMSKAGVIGHFGSKEALQLAALDRAVAVFVERVWSRAAHADAGRARLQALCEAWIAYLAGDCFPGGCVLTAAASEFDGRPGAVRDAVAAQLERWRAALEAEAATAVATGELPTGTDPAQVAFELSALGTGANQAIQLQGDPRAPERALAAMRRVLAP